MKAYVVTIHVDAYHYLNIQADNEEAAKEKALNKFATWSVIGNVDYDHAEIWEIEEVENDR